MIAKFATQDAMYKPAYFGRIHIRDNIFCLFLTIYKSESVKNQTAIIIVE